MREVDKEVVSQSARIIAVLGWSVACFIFWSLWMLASTSDMGPEDGNMVLGMLGCITIGVTGSVWFVGLVVGFLVYGITRR